MQGQESLGLSCDLPQRILPRHMFASDHTVITLDTATPRQPACHEPQQPLVALIQEARSTSSCKAISRVASGSEAWRNTLRMRRDICPRFDQSFGGPNALGFVVFTCNFGANFSMLALKM